MPWCITSAVFCRFFIWRLYIIIFHVVNKGTLISWIMKSALGMTENLYFQLFHSRNQSYMYQGETVALQETWIKESTRISLVRNAVRCGTPRPPNPLHVGTTLIAPWLGKPGYVWRQMTECRTTHTGKIPEGLRRELQRTCKLLRWTTHDHVWTSIF